MSLIQCPGINLSVYYSTVIFQNIGLSDFLAQLLAAVMNTLFATGTVLLPWTIERFGRRPILLWSAVGCTICMTIFVAMIGSPNPTLSKQWTAVVFVIIYNFIFGYGWIGVCWLYGPEVSLCMFRYKRYVLIESSDCSPQVPSCWWCRRCLRRMALLFHHSVRWRYCSPKRWLENLALDAAILCPCRGLRLLHVS